MKILVFNQQQDLSISTQSVRQVVKQVLALEKKKSDEVAVYLVSVEEISKIHNDFFGDPTPTDCISFPMDLGNKKKGSFHVLGELFVCPKVAINYVLTTNQDVGEDCYQETTLYLVHALLHLLGYDDIEEEDQKMMRSKEQEHMTHLIKNRQILKS